MPPDPIHPYLFRNPVSAGTHLLFCAWAVFVTGVLRRLVRFDAARLASVTLFGFSVVLLLGETQGNAAGDGLPPAPGIRKALADAQSQNDGPLRPEGGELTPEMVKQMSDNGACSCASEVS